MTTLTNKDILINVGDTYYARGEAYYRDGYVKSLVAEAEDDDIIELRSTVKNSSNQLYTQTITVDSSSRHIDIDGDCSCPVNYNCKHVAAACIQYVTDGAEVSRADAPCLSWIDEFNSAGATNVAATTNKEFLVYLLSPSAETGKLAVEFRVSRFLRPGEPGRTRDTNLNSIRTNPTATTFVQTIDREICDLIEANNELHWRGVLLYGDLGYLALTKMLPTGRCYWLNMNNQPLQLKQPRDLKLEWQTDADGDASLDMHIEPDGELLLTTPPLYLSEAGNCVGRLNNAAYSIPQLEQLMKAPTVPADLLDEFSNRLAQKIPSTVLVPPHQVDIQEIKDQYPTPCLSLAAREVEDDQEQHVMRLRFGYAEHELTFAAGEAITSITRNNDIVRIWRDLELEHAAIDQLKFHGFEARIDDNGKDLIFTSPDISGATEDINRWHQFLTETLAQLEQQGWQIEVANNFNMVFHEAEQWNIEVDEDGSGWFDLRFNVEIDNRPLELLPLIAQVLDQYEPDKLPETLTLRLGDNRYLNIASAQLKPVLNTLYELYEKDSLQHDGSLRLSRFDAARLNELDEQGANHLHWSGGENLRKLGKQLNDFQGITTVEPPKGLNINLRDYQKQGLNWLQFLREYGFAGILADDMGLGKTVQTLAYLLLEKEQGRMDKPCLIVAPTSLMSNWRREAEQFTPALKVLVLQGPERHEKFHLIAEHDLILSTYPLLGRDEETLLSHHYHTLVLDEAQVVKNPKAKAAQLIRQIKTDQRLCLTGTPMENHLGELWTQFDFLMPDFLGNLSQFNKLFRFPIEKHGNDERRQQLAQRVTPFMLRRTKAEVAQELPEKTEIIRTVTLQKDQAALYESIRISMEHKVRQAITNKGMGGSHITILDALLKLRQVCCDPRLIQLTQAREVKESAKLELLMQMLPEMVEEGRRILVFSAFTKMLAHIEGAIKKHDISYSKLTGQTRDRDGAIEKFKSGQADIFLISLKAGGVGLNLTEADTVIHYDPWWNPAAEQQATDRAHRIGQNKAVFVYKLVTENSVEEKIVAMQAKKQALADGVYNNGKQADESALSAEDLNQLFAPLNTEKTF